MECEYTHAPEVCGWVVALETNLLPLFSDTRLQRSVWHQMLPQLERKEGRGEEFQSLEPFVSLKQ